MNRVEVKKQILTCQRCSLHATCTRPVPFRGPSPARIMVVGEAPGRQEDEQGSPFVGPSGQLLDRWLADSRVPIEDTALANAVSCYPNRTPTPHEVAACHPNLHDQMALARPEYVLVVGGVALSAWWKDQRIGVLRGRWWKGEVDGLDYRPWFLATWHPSAVLRNSTLGKEATADVFKFSLRVRFGGFIPPPFQCLNCEDFATAWRNHKGEDVTDITGERSDGSLAWCQKHDDFRMGKAGQGRVTTATKAAKKASRVRKTAKKKAADLFSEDGGQ